MIRLEKQGDVFVLNMAAGENRWNTTFLRAFDEALDEVAASEGPAALVTFSENEKFFSNGLDLEWVSSEGEHPGGDRSVFGSEFMALLARMMTFPIPTVSAVNGHAFGAGLMIALCHDVRVMRADRGYLCANEVEIGMTIPEPELALFRCKIPMNAFFETVMLARRWTATDALNAGIIQQVAEKNAVLDKAIETATGLLRIAKNREIISWMKERIYGENAAINNIHGPAYMLRNRSKFRGEST